VRASDRNSEHDDDGQHQPSPADHCPGDSHAPAASLRSADPVQRHEAKDDAEDRADPDEAQQAQDK
jgi:hypothetical protein